MGYFKCLQLNWTANGAVTCIIPVLAYSLLTVLGVFFCCTLGAGRYIPPTGSSQPVSDVSMGGGSVDPFTGTRSNFNVKCHR